MCRVILLCVEVELELEGQAVGVQLGLSPRGPGLFDVQSIFQIVAPGTAGRRNQRPNRA